MSFAETHNSFWSRIARSVKILAEGGPSGHSNRVLQRINWVNLLVMEHHVDSNSQSTNGRSVISTNPRFERASRWMKDLEYRQVTAEDTTDLDVLTEIDEWKIPKTESLKKLGEGWHCYVAVHHGKIVATGWSRVGRISWTTISNGNSFLGPMRCFSGEDSRYRHTGGKGSYRFLRNMGFMTWPPDTK